jgi:arylsulfatase A-like enzyme
MHFSKCAFDMKMTVLVILALSGIFQTGCSREKQSENTIVAHDFTQRFDGVIYDNLPPLYFDEYTKNYLGKGWSSPEVGENGDSFIWSVGKESLVRFYAAELRDLTVTIDCAPLPVPDQQQSIAVVVNTKDVIALQLHPQFDSYTFIIPKAFLLLGQNVMTFRYAYTRTPETLDNKSTDTRELGVWFSRIDFGTHQGDEHVVVQETLKHLAQIARIKIGDDQKIGISQRPQSGILFDKCYIPPSASLKFALGIHPRVKSSDTNVTFSVVVKDFNLSPSQQTTAEEIFVETLNLQTPSDRAWKEYTVDLSAYAGKVLTVAFNVETQADPQTIIAMWGTPRIVARESSQQYNVVLITLDALRADHLGSYGYAKQTSPHIDAFSRDAVKFTQAYSVAPWTLPSFASYYTALYPQSHQVKEDQQHKRIGLPARFPTLPSFLKPYGYFTQLISNHPFFDVQFGLSKAFDNWDPDSLNRDGPFYIDTVQKWMKQHAEEKFFLHLHVMPPHNPYIAVAPYDEAFVDFDAPILNGAIKLFFSHYSDRLAPWDANVRWSHEITDIATRNYIVNLYDANVALGDEFFGKIIAQLKTFGLYDNTLIILSADHGDEFWEHGTMLHAHNGLYNEVLHVPLVVKFPKALKITPTEIHSPVATLDILPTILAVNGIPVPEYVQGKSFFNLEKKSVQDIDREYTYFAQAYPPSLEAVRWENYQYIYSPQKNSAELYDLVNDPFEQRNLAMEKSDIMEQLRTALANFQTNVTVGSPSQNAPQVDEDSVNRLRDLGYAK